MFKLTQEQELIVEMSKSSTKLSIEAFAGCSKSTTQYEIAKENPNKQFLLLVFSKALQMESEAKIKELGLKNMEAKTTHSLAYAPIVFPNKYKVRNNSYKAYEIVNQFKDKKYSQYNCFLALRVLEEFFNSDDTNSMLVLKKYEYIHEDMNKTVITIANDILKAMRSNKMEITHSFYIKEFHLKLVNEGYNIKKYDVLTLDEAQDTNNVTKAIFDLVNVKQKVKVGDEYQGIYGWRGAKNMMQDTEGWDKAYLTTSFRLPIHIAKHATRFLGVFRGEIKELKGVDKDLNQPIKTRAIITRTNSGMLQVIDGLVNDGYTFRTIRHPNEIFGTAIDLMYLMNKNYDKISNQSLIHLEKEFDNHNEKRTKNNRDKVSFPKYVKDELQDIDREVYTAMSYILNFGAKRVFDLKNKALEYYNNKTLAENYTLTTGHTSKGLEFDEVTISDDFQSMFEIAYKIYRKKYDVKEEITYDKYMKAVKEYDNSDLLFDELNLWYVGATRSKLELIIKGSNQFYMNNYDEDMFIDRLEEYRRVELDKQSEKLYIDAGNSQNI